MTEKPNLVCTEVVIDGKVIARDVDIVLPTIPPNKTRLEEIVGMVNIPNMQDTIDMLREMGFTPPERPVVPYWIMQSNRHLDWLSEFEHAGNLDAGRRECSRYRVETETESCGAIESQLKVFSSNLEKSQEERGEAYSKAHPKSK